jgi:hypothetical protein
MSHTYSILSWATCAIGIVSDWECDRTLCEDRLVNFFNFPNRKLQKILTLNSCERIEKLLVFLCLMITVDLFPTLRSLPRAEKLQVMQFLIAELAQEEEPTLQAGATYSLLSPLNSHEAAHKLSQLLDADRTA